jgi:hypothetical protein
MVMGIILFMGKAGAHLNLAVSIAFALRRDFPMAASAGLRHDPVLFLRTCAHLYPGDLRAVADARISSALRS